MATLRKLVPILLVFTLLFAATSLAACSNTAVSQDPYEAAKTVARTEVWKEINSGKSSSGTVAIMDNGKIVYSEGFGMADRKKSIPVDSQTIFNIGSSSKMFVSTAVMLLVDEGKVSLDAPVIRYLPEFTMADPRYKDITVRMLLNHTSGLPGSTYANATGYAYDTSYYDEVLANLAQSHLKAAPGATAPYCNDGFTLAEMLVAKVSGQPYMDFLREREFNPLSLTMGPSVGERTDKTVAAYYSPADGTRPPLEVLSVLGAGALSATAEDLVRFMDTFSGKGPQILSSSSISEMIKAQPSAFTLSAEKKTGINPEGTYGLGFDMTDIPTYSAQGIKVLGKGGDTDVYHSIMLSVPDQRISVAVIEAGQASHAPSIGLAVLDSVLESKGLMKKQTESVSKPPEPQSIPASYQAFAGFYNGGTPSRFSFDFTNNVALVVPLRNGTEGQPIALSYRDGRFSDDSGRVSFSLISVDGRDYVVTGAFNNAINMITGERLQPEGAPLSLGIDINGRQWLRRNVKPFEGMSMDAAEVVVSYAVAGLPGYVDFTGLKKIVSPDFAGMVSDALRDETELNLLTVDGETWARVSDTLYSPSDLAVPLNSGASTVTITGTGYNEWRRATAEFILGFEKPAQGRVIVLSPEGSPLYDSVVDSGEVYVPAGSFIEMAGTPNDVFKVTAKPAAGN